MAHVTPVEAGAVVAPLDAVRARISAAGGSGAVRIVAVTKGFGADAVAAALAAGLSDVGESYAPELEEKAAHLAHATPATAKRGRGGAHARDGGGSSEVRWHFIGRLQSNKVKRLVGIVHLWQSVDRQSVLAELSRRAPGAGVLVQVNVSGETQKGGCDPADTGALVGRALAAGLDVRGLMCVAAPGGNEAARPGFRLLRSLADDLGLDERSMGMSGDLEAAVEEGSTMVRVGGALFGPRAPQGGGPRGGATGLRH